MSKSTEISFDLVPVDENSKTTERKSDIWDRFGSNRPTASNPWVGVYDRRKVRRD